MRRFFLSLFVFLLPFFALAQPSSTQVDNDEILLAKELAKEALHHYDQGEYEDAILKYQKAYQLFDNPDILYNISLCYRKLDRPEEEQEYLCRYLERPYDVGIRTKVETRLIEVFKETNTTECPEPELPESLPVSLPTSLPDNKPVIIYSPPILEPRSKTLQVTGIAAIATGAVLEVLWFAKLPAVIELSTAVGNGDLDVLGLDEEEINVLVAELNENDLVDKRLCSRKIRKSLKALAIENPNFDDARKTINNTCWAEPFGLTGVGLLVGGAVGLWVGSRKQEKTHDNNLTQKFLFQPYVRTNGFGITVRFLFP